MSEVTVEIPEDVLRALAALPDRASGPQKAAFEPWEDAVIIQYWATGLKKQRDLAKILGRCTNTIRKRFEELKAEGRV